MFYSVIIPSCNRNDLLSKCLDLLTPLNQNIDASEYEVIITDDSKDQIAKELVSEKYSWAKWLAGPRKGPAANRNNGAKVAKGEWLIFLDDDCLPDNTLIAAYSSSIEKHKNISVFEGSIHCDEVITSPLYTSPINLSGGYLWSCNFCIRRELFTQIGGFDENYKYPNMEDVDLNVRLKKLSIPVLFVKDASVRHPPRKIASPSRLALYHSSWLYYHKKHSDEKGVADLLKTIFINRLREVKNRNFSMDSILALKNMITELTLTTIKYGFKKNY